MDKHVSLKQNNIFTEGLLATTDWQKTWNVFAVFVSGNYLPKAVLDRCFYGQYQACKRLMLFFYVSLFF